MIDELQEQSEIEKSEINMQDIFAEIGRMVQFKLELLQNENLDKQKITKDKLAEVAKEKSDVRKTLSSIDSLLEILVLFSDKNLEEQILSLQ